MILDFEGFPADNPAPTPGIDRQRMRWRAYDELRRAQLLLEGGDPAEAPGLLASAFASARASGDPYLPGWIERVEAQALAAAGRTDEAEALFEELLETSPRPGDVLFEAGRAFHLAGDPRRAARWYRREIAQEDIGWRGRQQYEVLQGLIFALGELGLWEEALADLERYARFSAGNMETHRRFVLWRRGLAVRLPPPHPQAVDPERYWHLEMRWSRGEEPAPFLAEVEEELDRASRTVPMLLSLQAEVLGRLGRTEEAVASARTAYEEARNGLHRDILLRPHFEVIAERLAALLRETGEGTEATRVEMTLAEWRQGHR